MVYGVNNENEGKFTLVYPEDKYLIPSEGNLVFSSTPPADEHTHGVDGGEGDIVWTKWDGTTNLTEAGYYYLAENAEPTAAIEVTADVHLCLNGCTISREKTSGSEVFKVTGKLTICDCSEEGTGEVKININSSSAAVQLTNSGKLTLYSGTLDGGSGNGVFASGSSTKVTITGGAVMGKRDNGCALGLDSATATITGGTVEGVRLQGIYGKLYLGGNPSVGPVLLYTTDGSAIYKSQIHAVANDVPYTGNTITINTKYKNMAPDTYIVYNVNDDNASKFTLTDYQLERKENNLVIAKNKDITLNVTVPALNYGDTKPLEIEVVPADATLTYKVTGKTPSDTSTAIKVEDGQITAGAVGNFILTMTATKDGYSQKQETVSFSVSKAALTVKAEDKSITYGDAAPVYTATYTGFVGDDGAEDLTGTLTFTCAYTKGSPVGTYPITPKGLTSNNYSISFVDGTLTVTENAVPMPTAPVGKTLTYNSGLQDLIIPGSAEHGTMYYSLSQNGPWNAAVPQAKDAGVYTVWYKVVGDPGYSDTAPNSVTAVINKAPLTIKALDRRAYVGERMPAFAYDVVGLLGSDTLDKAPSFSCNANMNMPGTYVIRIFGAEAANYDISYVNGILTVEHRFVIPGYKITVVVVGKGEASASAGWADAGSVISVSSKADEGYTLGSITVETESGRSVAMKDGKFTMPNDSVVVTVTFEKKGEPFYDVRPGDWFYDAVTWASKNGIVLGVTEDTYRPNDPVTREQLAAILFRYADYKGYDTSASADLTGYADYAEVSAYAVPALRWACGCGIIDGSAGKLDPRSGATRAQLATMLMRFDKAAK